MNSFKFNTKTWPLYYAMHSLPFPNGDEMCLNETIVWSTTLTRLHSSTYFTGETVTSYLSVKGFSSEKVWVCAIERWHVLKSKNRALIQKRNKTFSPPFFWGDLHYLSSLLPFSNWKENIFCSSRAYHLWDWHFVLQQPAFEMPWLSLVIFAH